jgi:uncharacterized membrane protein affecting hemolysin expression
VISRRLELIFVNSQGKNVTVGVVDPKEDLTAEAVETSMQSVINANIFDSGGDLVAITGARVVTREVNNLLVY